MATNDPHSSSTRNSVGDCPRCHASLPASAVIIEYEVEDRGAAYAACPACEAVVAPQ